MGVLRPRTTTVLLFHGDDLERLADLHQEKRVAQARVESAARKRDAAEGGSGAAVLADEESPESEAAREHAEALAAHEAADTAYNAAVDEASERALEVRLQAIGSTRFSDLLLAHPARTSRDEDGKPEVHEDDLAFGRAQEYGGFRPVLVDVSKFGKALLKHREGRATIVDPDLSEAELAEFLDDECAEGDIEQMWTAAFYLNRGLADPKGTRSSTASTS